MIEAYLAILVMALIGTAIAYLIDKYSKKKPSK
jgi:hypothetical protein